MSKLNNHLEEMIQSSTPSIKLNLVRDYPSKEPKCLIVCHHGIMVNLNFYDKFSKEANNLNIIVYRYDARGHGKSEGKRGYVKSIFEMVEDLKIIIDLAKKENPNIPIYTMGHSMGGHVNALFATKYPNQVKGVIIASGLLKDNFHLFGNLPLEGEPEKSIPISEAIKLKVEDEKVQKEFAKALQAYPNLLVELTISIMNSFVEGFDYLKKNDKNFKEPVLILNGNADFAVSEKDAIDFYMEIENKDKSLILFSGIGHMLWEEEKGDIVISQVLNWIQRRLK